MRRFAAVCEGLLAISVAACGARASSDASGDASVPIARDGLATISSIVRVDRTLDAVVRPRVDGLAFANGAIEAAPAELGDLRVRLPLRARGVVAVGTDPEHALGLALDGAADAEASIDEGRVIYRDVFPSTDVAWAATNGRVESLLLLRDEAAPTAFRWSLARPSDLPSTADDGGGGLVLRDAKGRDRLRIPAPYAIDTAGVRRAAHLALDGDALVVSLDTAGLVYPIVLDPAVEARRWVKIGGYVPDVGYRPGPRGRAYGSLVWDPARKVPLAFGGYDKDGSALSTPGIPTNALLAYSASGAYPDWVALTPGPSAWAPYFPTYSPPFHTAGWSAAFDVHRGKLVAIGSRDAAGARLFTWEWDSATNAWSERCASGCANVPPYLREPIVAYDETTKVVVTIDRGNGKTWTWNGASGAWSNVGAAPGAVASAFFDGTLGKVVAATSAGMATFGGSSWTTLPAAAPAPLYQIMATTYDRARKRGVAVVNHAGSTDTFEWNGSAWSLVVDGYAASVAPTFEPYAAMTYDAARGRVVLWGGGRGQTGDGYDPGVFSSQVWEYQAWGGACATSADCSGGSCLDGVCCDTVCGACRTCAKAGAEGTCAPFAGAAVVGTEHDVCTGTSACDASGGCKKKVGQTCTTGTECTSGNCVDGFCCASGCGGNCQVCNVTPGTCTPAPKGSGGRTGCGVGLCDGVSTTCSTSCATDADCSSSGFCDAGTCKAVLAIGAACARDRMCGSGACADGRCCNGPCDGACDVCAKSLGASADGTCTPLPSSAAPAGCLGYTCSGTSGACAKGCTTDAACAAGHYCDGAFCQPVREQGQTCTRTAQCKSGFTCADGVCCNSACDGVCQACAAERKESGTGAGVCGAAKAGTDPGDKCPATAASTCGTTGVCGATGTCALWPAGAACGASGASICEGGAAKGRTCDGLGACRTDPTGVACAPGVCKDGGCVVDCTVDADCDANAFCDAGTCRTKEKAGAKCAAAAQCDTGFCADGVCCASACDGICEACDAAGTAGTCVAVKGAPREGHGTCPGASATDPCTASACDGSERTSCKGLAIGVACRAGTCAEDVETLAAECEGTGACPAAKTRACAPYACGTTKCKESCSADSDCVRPATCDTASGKCIRPATCEDDHTVKGADGRLSDCSPFKCASGACLSSCAASTDCVTDALCDGGKCVLRGAAGPSTDDGGGCVLGPPTRTKHAGAVAIAMALLAMGARRRRVSR